MHASSKESQRMACSWHKSGGLLEARETLETATRLGQPLHQSVGHKSDTPRLAQWSRGPRVARLMTGRRHNRSVTIFEHRTIQHKRRPSGCHAAPCSMSTWNPRGAATIGRRSKTIGQSIFRRIKKSKNTDNSV